MLLLLGVAIVGGRALADADCGDSEPPKAAKGKCPAGYKYSAKTKGCAKVSCRTDRVWSGKQQKQLMEIADRCGDSCEEYVKLEKAIVTFVTGDGKATSW